MKFSNAPIKPQLNIYHFSSIFCLQCYQYLINVYIYVVPLSANTPTVLYNLYVLMSWPEDMDMLWIEFLGFVSVFCSANLSCSKIVYIQTSKTNIKWRGT